MTQSQSRFFLVEVQSSGGAGKDHVVVHTIDPARIDLEALRAATATEGEFFVDPGQAASALGAPARATQTPSSASVADGLATSYTPSWRTMPGGWSALRPSAEAIRRPNMAPPPKPSGTPAGAIVAATAAPSWPALGGGWARVGTGGGSSGTHAGTAHSQAPEPTTATRATPKVAIRSMGWDTPAGAIVPPTARPSWPTLPGGWSTLANRT